MLNEQRMIPFFEKISSLVMPAAEEAAQEVLLWWRICPWSPGLCLLLCTPPISRSILTMSLSTGEMALNVQKDYSIHW